MSDLFDFVQSRKQEKDIDNHKNDKNNPHGVTAEQVGAKKATIQLDANTDLNTILEEGEYTWLWWQETIKNAPVHSGFKLEVHEIGSGIFEQIYHEYKDDLASTIYYRCGNSAGWSAWSRQFLPLTGGTLSGKEIKLDGGTGQFYSDGNAVVLTSLDKNKDWNTHRRFQINNNSYSPDLKYSVQAIDVVNGVSTAYNIFGEHNTELLRNTLFTASTTDIGAGSALATGKIHLTYE